MSRKQIGNFTSEIINLLNLDIPVGTPIYIGESNIEHIKSRDLMSMTNISVI